MKKVSFDFDGTLSRIDVQKYAKRLLKDGLDVHVLTARVSDEPGLISNEDLYTVTDRIGISRDDIQFWPYSDKANFFREEKNRDFIWHLDDCWFETDAINKYTDIIGLCILSSNNWALKADDLIYSNMKTKQNKDLIRKTVNKMLNEYEGEDLSHLLMDIKETVENILEREKSINDKFKHPLTINESYK